MAGATHFTSLVFNGVELNLGYALMEDGKTVDSILEVKVPVPDPGRDIDIRPMLQGYPQFFIDLNKALTAHRESRMFKAINAPTDTNLDKVLVRDMPKEEFVRKLLNEWPQFCEHSAEAIGEFHDFLSNNSLARKVDIKFNPWRLDTSFALLETKDETDEFFKRRGITVPRNTKGKVKIDALKSVAGDYLLSVQPHVLICRR